MSQEVFHVHVPATSANLGPGFDCLALSLDLWNHTTFQVTGQEFLVDVRGEGEGVLPIDEKNLIINSFFQGMDTIGQPIPQGIRVSCHNLIPPMSGLGSSAAAVLTGLLAANHLAGTPLSNEEILKLANKIEGHPDNISAALLGGLVVAVLQDGQFVTKKFDLPEMQVVVVLPQIAISTSMARAILPEHYSRSEIVFNLGRVPLTIEALLSGDFTLLRVSMQDRLHQPYRLAHIPGADAAIQAARDMDAVATLSGAGPGLICFLKGDPHHVSGKIESEFLRNGIHSKTWILNITNRGAYLDE